MEETMQSNSFFIVPLTLAYLSACVLWFLLDRGSKSWQIETIEKPPKPWIDLMLGLVACVVILVIGQLYSAGYLIPQSGSKVLNYFIWPLNNVIIFSPIFLVLLIRKQSLKTVFISGNEVPLKLLFGLVASIVGILIFLSLRGELSRIPEIAARSVKPGSLSSFPATFFENVAIAFLFVRLKWVLGMRWAIAVPALLFAFSHVPGSLAEGDSWGTIITFFILTGGLTTFILYTAYRSRDILWLGALHYLMDVTIKVF